MTVAEAIARGRAALLRAGIPAEEAPGDAEVLARHALGWDLTRLAVSARDAAPAAFAGDYAALIGRRIAREPVSQIVGHREFWGLEFNVTRDVLTPRPETETLVQAALDTIDRQHTAVVADVGTGSGCIAVALAVERPALRLVASDVSAAALAVARANARRHGAGGRIAFVQTDLVPTNDVDLVVSNPPYLARRDGASLPPEVRDYEPHVALFGGEDGLDVYRRLVADARGSIASGGSLIVEVGYDQADAVATLAAAAGWRRAEVRRDLQGIERVLVLQSI
jgi:release factor glutamine methyltransferase